MARVDFYIWPMCNRRQHEKALCHIVQAAYKTKMKAIVFFENSKDCEYFDSLLWTFEDVSFIPHGRDDHIAPITLTTEGDNFEAKLLINLSEIVPKFADSFEQIIETAGHDDASRTIARQKYNTYRKEEYEIFSHELKAITSHENFNL